MYRIAMRTAMAFVAATLVLVAPSAADGQAGPARWVDNLEPIGPGDWNYDFAAHLLERAGFGGTPKEIEAWPR